MGTPARAGIVNEDGTVTHIYINCDGNFKEAGIKLERFYRTEKKVRSLMRLGNLSILGKYLGKKHKLYQDNQDWCLAYGRDWKRKEQNCETGSVLDFEIAADENGAQFVYLFKDGAWTGAVVYDTGGTGKYYTIEKAISIFEDEGL